MKGMTTCKVCGRDFPLMAEEHYIARDAEKTGIANIISGSEATLYDAFECPHCGCQNIIQERKVNTATEWEDETEEEVPEHDDCAGCVHESCTCEEMPCKECKYNHPDYYTPKEEEDE